MIQKDLTILFYTSNKNSSFFMRNTQKQLLKAVGDTPIICVSFQPTVIGNNCTNIVVGEEEERSNFKLYKQVLIAAKAAKTEYVATAEDDFLYHPSHFDYRPSGNVFAYNVNKWSIFSWVQPPIFSYRSRKLMSSLIVKREALIKNLEERYAKHSTFEDFKKIEKYFGECGRFENHLGITTVETEEYKSEYPNIMFSTEDALGFLGLGKRKAHSTIRVDYVEPWGSARKILSLYKK